MFRRIACILALGGLVVCSLCGQAEPKKVSKAEALVLIVAKTAPVYPPIAKQMKVEGTVELEAVLSEEGRVEKVNIVSGNPLLTRAGAEALKGWKFKPFVDDGKPVKVIAPVSFTFKLGD